MPWRTSTSAIGRQERLYGSRCQQAGKYTVEFCKTIVKGIQRDLENQLCYAFAAEDLLEDAENQDDSATLDGIHGPDDLGKLSAAQEVERNVTHEEDLELLDKDADPEGEKLRKQEWRKLSKAERVGIRRLHHMTSHATKSQMTRMLRYSNADKAVIRAVRHFRCPSCDRIAPVVPMFSMIPLARTFSPSRTPLSSPSMCSMLCVWGPTFMLVRFSESPMVYRVPTSVFKPC